jgi:hypothetical protein
LARSFGISANRAESPGTLKTLIKNDYFENTNDINAPKTASQAYDEGSIPFTRSKPSQKQRCCARRAVPGRDRAGPVKWFIGARMSGVLRLSIEAMKSTGKAQHGSQYV